MSDETDEATARAQAAAADLKRRIESLDGDGLDLIFREARTYRAWQAREVSDETLRRVWDLARWGATSGNCCPGRIVFLKSDAAKERLKPALDEGNVDQTMAAPVCAIVGYDLAFYRDIEWLAPLMAGMAKVFAKNAALAETTAFRNGSLQGAYLMIAARALGLDCGPMSGFDNDLVDETFFAGTEIRSNFLCNLGYGDPGKLYPRGPRHAFDQACRIL
ncbi:MAG: malonic semialdehyde reductase [Kiloniellales bacterium]|nr:malonic semialdehyde reductase [Kiloniellales bacterium]